MVPVTILINSFDAYSDCWAPVCHGFTKYWPDCPYPILLMTTGKDFSHRRINVLKVGGGRDWSARMLEALERITTPYVMYFQEDYWITEPVDTARVTSYVALMEKYGLNYIRLLSKPIPDADFAHDARLGVLAEDADYRTSVQISLWRRQVFLSLVRPRESVWEFESNGSPRSRSYGDTFLSTKRHEKDDYSYGIRYVCTAINRGKWARTAKAYAKSEGLRVDFSQLPSETWWDDFKRGNRLGGFLGLWLHRAQFFINDPGAAIQKIRDRRASL